jgi:TolA-binding protein
MFLNIRHFVGLSFILLTITAAWSQVKTGGSGGGSTTSTRTTPSTSIPSIPPEALAIVIRGRVALQDGAVPPEPIAIERVCNGAVRREGYTDFKGNFEFSLGQGSVARDATESGRDVFQNSGNRSATTGAGSEFGITMPSNSRSTDATRPELFGCEVRASLPGFRTTSVMLRPDGSSFALNVGVIVLTPMENVSGAVISMTTLAAPPDARQAYEKGEKALEHKKFLEAEKELRKAVAQYSGFAAAWSLLGEVNRQKADFAAAKEDYLHAIAADPKFVNPYYGMAIVSVHEKNWADVLKYTGEIKKLNPALYPLAFMYSAAANYYSGNLDAAEESARTFEKLDIKHNSPESALLLSNILLAKHDYSGAAKTLEVYLKILPDAPNAAEIKKQLKDLEAMSVAKQQ